MKAKRHCSWLPEFDYGMMVFSQTGVFDAFHTHYHLIDTPRERFYQNPTNLTEVLEPFGVRHVAAPMVILAVGYLLAIVGLCYELAMSYKHGSIVLLSCVTALIIQINLNGCLFSYRNNFEIQSECCKFISFHDNIFLVCIYVFFSSKSILLLNELYFACKYESIPLICLPRVSY